MYYDLAFRGSQMKARKARCRMISRSQMPWLVEYLPEGKWDLPWNWKVYCKTFTKSAAERAANRLLEDKNV